MNGGKILLANLSQGRLGEDNAALLGAMLITKFQQAAMHRVAIPEDQRRDFYLYVDEFQNFATGSFIKIMSEARKYRLDIMLANQYMAQIPEEVTKAILGNAGTVMTFAVGAGDADILTKEFAEVFTTQDLINLGKYEIATKMTIDGQVTRPFVSVTLPLPISSNQNKDKVIEISRQRWARKLPAEIPPIAVTPTTQPPTINKPVSPVNQFNPQSVHTPVQRPISSSANQSRPQGQRRFHKPFNKKGGTYEQHAVITPKGETPKQ